MMTAASPTLELAAAACNRTSHAAAWARSGLAAFAAGRSVCLCRPLSQERSGVFEVLRGHGGRVSCVAFVDQDLSKLLEQDATADPDVLVSAAADGSCILWSRPAGSVTKWKMSIRFEAHSQPIVALAVQRISGTNQICIVTTASDGTIRVWAVDPSNNEGHSDKAVLVQTIKTGRHHMMALALAPLPSTQIPMLIAAGTDARIHVYVHTNAETADRPAINFVHKVALEGHTDWVRSIAVAQITSASPDDARSHGRLCAGNLAVATASQDKHIRIWRVAIEDGSTDHRNKTADQDGFNNEQDSMLDALRRLEIGGSNDDDGETTKLSTRAHLVPVDLGNGVQKTYSFMFDALLMGHDDWVHSISWHPVLVRSVAGDADRREVCQPMTLVSASADKSIMVWEPDTETAQWIHRARLGEVGGSMLGFYCAQLSASGDGLIATGHGGAIHVWRRADPSISTDWEPTVGISGHGASVKTVAWDPSGSFFLSTSADQTTRLFAPWKRIVDGQTTPVTSWHEIARPQIHGYDINCIAFVHKYQYVCGADEKVVRVFDAPRTFAQSLEQLTGDREDQSVLDKRPIGASVPALGLSNKAVYEDDMKDSANSHDYRNLSAYTAVAATPTSMTTALTHPPFEEHLLQHTLWPETDKLYGHGYEIIAVAVNHAGTLAASASKATKADYASVRLWSTKTWKQVSTPLMFHALTVTTIRFSPDDRWVLTAGRDRGWALFDVSKATEDGSDGAWTLVASQPKAHARIIWAVDWSPDGRYFATASRDKSVKIWGQTKDGAWNAVTSIKFDESVTSIAFWHGMVDSKYLIAAGLETGEIRLVLVGPTNNNSGDSWTSLNYPSQIATEDQHVMAVKSLAWRPSGQSTHLDQPSSAPKYLVSCSEDYSVRLFKFDA